jgi:uncharacterized protein
MPAVAPAPAAPALAGYRAPAWLLGGGTAGRGLTASWGQGALGGNLQTIWPALWSRRWRDGPLSWHRQRWTAPDGDFVDIDFAAQAAGSSPRPHLVLFHGLEGSSQSHYAQAFADAARRLGWAMAVPHFRGCSGELNLGPRAYHSGDHEEIGWILQRLRSHWDRPPNEPAASTISPLMAIGISLGGNALLRWAEEQGHAASRVAAAVSSMSSPIDLAAGGEAIGRGFNRLVYTGMFLRTMKPKALRKLAQHPGLFDADALQRARTLYEFDNVFTAPLHGFRDTEDYWRRASAKPALGDIRIPALVLNALNDPFLPGAALPSAAEVNNPWVQLAQPVHGGHVGFAQGRAPGEVTSIADQVCAWLAEAAGVAAPASQRHG